MNDFYHHYLTMLERHDRGQLARGQVAAGPFVKRVRANPTAGRRARERITGALDQGRDAWEFWHAVGWIAKRPEYSRQWVADDAFVLTLTGDRICAMTRFYNGTLPRFGLPLSLPSR